MLHEGEPYAGALKFIRTMKALEDAEEFLSVFPIDPGAVVPDEIHPVRGLSPAAHL